MNTKHIQTLLIIFLGVLLPSMCGLFAQEKGWMPAEFRELETKFLELKAQADILDMFAPEKLPNFEELEKTNQLVEQLEFNRRKLKLLVTQYNQLEETLFPFLLRYLKGHPELSREILAKVREYTGSEAKSILLLQEKLNFIALQVDRLEKKLEQVRAAAGNRVLTEGILQKNGVIRQAPDISEKIRQLEEAWGALSAELREKEVRLIRLKEKEKKSSAEIEKKKSEIDALKNESVSGSDIEALIARTFIQVKNMRLNGLEIPRLNTVKTFVYLTENNIETFNRKMVNIKTQIASLEKKKGRALIYKMLKGVVVIVAAFLVVFILIALARRVGQKIASEVRESEDLDTHRKQRYQTLSTVIVSFVKVAVWVMAVLWILGQLGIDYTPFLVAAGGISLAIGFGAQSLVKDVVAGFFILMEEQFALGDSVEIGGRSGSVEKISLRTIRLRGMDGSLHIIPNGTISDVSNKTYQWAQAVVKVGASYNDEPRGVIAVLESLCREFAEDPEWKESLIEEPIAQGIISFGESGIEYRILAKTISGKQWGVGRELNIRIKQAFDREGIEIPYNYLNIIERKEKTQEVGIKKAEC